MQQNDSLADGQVESNRMAFNGNVSVHDMAETYMVPCPQFARRATILMAHSSGVLTDGAAGAAGPAGAAAGHADRQRDWAVRDVCVRRDQRTHISLIQPLAQGKPSCVRAMIASLIASQGTPSCANGWMSNSVLRKHWG